MQQSRTRSSEESCTVQSIHLKLHLVKLQNLSMTTNLKLQVKATTVSMGKQHRTSIRLPQRKNPNWCKQEVRLVSQRLSPVAQSSVPARKIQKISRHFWIKTYQQPTEDLPVGGLTNWFSQKKSSSLKEKGMTFLSHLHRQITGESWTLAEGRCRGVKWEKAKFSIVSRLSRLQLEIWTMGSVFTTKVQSSRQGLNNLRNGLFQFWNPMRNFLRECGKLMPKI